MKERSKLTLSGGWATLWGKGGGALWVGNWDSNSINELIEFRCRGRMSKGQGQKKVDWAAECCVTTEEASPARGWRQTGQPFPGFLRRRAEEGRNQNELVSSLLAGDMHSYPYVPRFPKLQLRLLRVEMSGLGRQFLQSSPETSDLMLSSPADVVVVEHPQSTSCEDSVLLSEITK